MLYQYFGLGASLRKGDGAGTKIRTRDLMITNQLLYQLSYTGILHQKDAIR